MLKSVVSRTQVPEYPPDNLEVPYQAHLWLEEESKADPARNAWCTRWQCLAHVAGQCSAARAVRISTIQGVLANVSNVARCVRQRKTLDRCRGCE